MFGCKSKNTKQTFVLTMSGKLTVDSGKEIKKGLLEALGSGKDVVLELKDITEIDLSFIQILCAAHRTAKRRSNSLKVGTPAPDIFMKTVEDSGFSIHEDYACMPGIDKSDGMNTGGRDE
jgi:anti-anti-sigma regulatory factor